MLEGPKFKVKSLVLAPFSITNHAEIVPLITVVVIIYCLEWPDDGLNPRAHESKIKLRFAPYT